jgi:hypothetical protein
MQIGLQLSRSMLTGLSAASLLVLSGAQIVPGLPGAAKA